jgi:carboxyl-terminal processing protease
MEATATAPLPPVMATQQALMAQVTIAPRPAGTQTTIAADDYPAIVDQACAIVSENYVRDNFNGIDWEATCADYHARAEQIDNQNDFWDLMQAFIAELDDDHSRFVRPDAFAGEFRLPQEGAGIPWPGMELSTVSGTDRVVVWSVCDVGPAASAGIRRGDAVLAIDGRPVSAGTEGIDRLELNRLMYAEGKDEVTLTILQGPGVEPQDVAVRYGGASGCDGWRYGLLSDMPRVGYIRIPAFGGEAGTNVLTMIERLEADGVLDGLVVDVRHNPGGNADETIKIFTTGTFGRIGPLRADATQTIWRVRGPVIWNETTPVAVLIDGGSASAAEYFAVAMQLSARATLVGAATSGNTEGITGFNLADGSLIRLAVQTLQFEDGTTLEGRGVQPDIAVPMGDWGLRETPDVQLQAAFDFLAGR